MKHMSVDQSVPSPRKMTKPKVIGFAAGLFLAGFMIGGYLFADTQRRTVLALHNCEKNCLRPNELAGLLVSVGIQRFPSFIPSIVMQTDKTLVIAHPSPQDRIHYVIIPKKDIKNIGELSEDDREYLVDAFSAVSHIVKDQHLKQYEVITNGPAYQAATYLHFHLIAQ